MNSNYRNIKKKRVHNSIHEYKMVKGSNLNHQEIFKLIDSILPMQVCLSHKVLPISLCNNILSLGMVKSEDIWLLEHLKSLLSRQNYIIQKQKITPETHQLILTAYQEYIDSNAKVDSLDAAVESESNISNTQPTELPSSIENPNEKPTFIIDKNEAKKEMKARKKSSKSNLPPLGVSLHVKSQRPSASLKSLSSLNSKELWDELLFRVIQSGIGRLSLERHLNYGRVIWSQNGVLKDSLEKISIAVFDDLIDQLKTLGDLPLITLEKSKRVEIERYYNGERLLLRLQFLPGKFGEESTIQVLRDKALTFYQERQMEILGEQALRLAQQLERKLKQIEVLSQINPVDLRVLSLINAVQEKIQTHLESLD